MGGHRLVLARHAKAEPYAAVDHARRLTARGRTEALAAGRFLGSLDLRPDRALVSDSARTVETWELICEALGTRPPADITRELYGAGADGVLDLLRALHDDVGTAVYVGHNPTAEYLAGVLHDTEGDPAVLQRLLAGLPTAGVVVFEVPGSWAELEEGGARLTHVHAPH